MYAINPPHSSAFSKLKISEITNVGRIPNNALSLENINGSPFHNAEHHKAKSLKYWEVKEKLEVTNYKIINVESKGYLERYTVINNANEEFILQASHKLSGHFIDRFEVVNKRNTAEEKELEEVFNLNYTSKLSLNYSPSLEFLESLYFRMRACCLELEISITNIDEQVEKYFVNYFLRTDSTCSNIQFYFKKNGSFSRALPKTFDCQNDNKLQLLIEKLEEYAS